MNAPGLGGRTLCDECVMSTTITARTADLRAVFESLELFQTLSASEVSEVVGACTAEALEAHTLLFEQGDESDALYIVRSGTLEVSAVSPLGEKVVLATLGQGTVVGEMSLIEGGPRSATVSVVDEVEVLKLSRASFEAMRRAGSKAAYKIILGLARTVGERRRRTDERVEEVFLDPDDHIDAFESQLHDMLGRLRKA
ncbi:cyclic nucleotide-binding domain-containing protein [Lujinxingia sediminis]|uniref:Cyclic nucleotide-binding domain-containing protein n=2 Tax=Lujinxingia sediminis TaxID=2480984 RepID=A0ABY0CPD1_9DELT|nr:cyclic nucleotide-binding domain-containing protein [Lujinxingia sediminis]